MFLAVRELRFAWARFGLMGLVVSLIAVLVILLSGLSTGLVNDGVSGLQRLPVDAFAFDADAKKDSAFSRSVVDDGQVAAWAARPDVADAEPFGNLIVNTESNSGEPVDLTLFGVVDGSFLLPAVADGRVPAGPGELLVSSTAAEDGVALGDVLTVDRLGTPLTVVGVAAEQHTFGHVDVAFVPLSTWQEIRAGASAGEPMDADSYTEATAVALRGTDGTPDLAAGDADAATTSMTLEGSFDASPGFTAETGTLSLIQVFLFVIAALVVGAFFTVWTIQRAHEIAVLRAIGASTGYLLRDGLAQAAVLLVVATAVGSAVGLAVGGLVGDDIPFALETAPVTTAVTSLIVLGLLGAAVSIARIAFAEPVAALGGSR
jgi:putative ABC transport system permease protein